MLIASLRCGGTILSIDSCSNSVSVSTVVTNWQGSIWLSTAVLAGRRNGRERDIDGGCRGFFTLSPTARQGFYFAVTRELVTEHLGKCRANCSHPNLAPPWCEAAIQALGLAFLGRWPDLKGLQI
jgi:hypothetical protein